MLPCKLVLTLQNRETDICSSTRAITNYYTEGGEQINNKFTKNVGNLIIYRCQQVGKFTEKDIPKGPQSPHF